MTYAVIKTGGKQYRVAADDLLEIEKVSGEVGDLVKFTEVLMMGGAGAPSIGKPSLPGVSVTAEVIEQGRGPKLIIFKKRRRKNSRNKKGHRQDLTTVRILEVLASGQNPSKQPTGEGKKKALAKKNSGRKYETLAAAEGEADDLSLIDGVGPAMQEKLHQAGIFHFWQLAAMSKGDANKLEDTHDFDGRILREEWREQARELMYGKPPRAKSDRERAEHEADKA